MIFGLQKYRNLPYYLYIVQESLKIFRKRKTKSLFTCVEETWEGRYYALGISVFFFLPFSETNSNR